MYINKGSPQTCVGKEKNSEIVKKLAIQSVESESTKAMNQVCVFRRRTDLRELIFSLYLFTLNTFYHIYYCGLLLWKKLMHLIYYSAINMTVMCNNGLSLFKMWKMFTEWIKIHP